MIIIAGCMIFLNIFTTQKLSALEHSKKDAMFVMDEIVFNNDEDFTKEIVEYLPEPYKLIEVYNEKLELQFHVEFNNHHDTKKDSLSNYPNLIRLSDEYLSNLDNSLGFTYLDEYFERLRPTMKNYLEACNFLDINNHPLNKDIREEKVEFFSNNLINTGNVNGYFERALLYQFLNDNFLNKREKRYVKVLIEDGLSDNPFISYNILRTDEKISYVEEKTSKGYSLVKK